MMNVPNSVQCSVPLDGTTVSDCVHYTSVKRREWNCLYERRSVTALYSRSFHRSSQSDNTKSGHLAYTVGVSAHLHKIAFRPASNASMDIIPLDDHPPSVLPRLDHVSHLLQVLHELDVQISSIHPPMHSIIR